MFELVPRRYHVTRNYNPYSMLNLMNSFFEEDQPITNGIRTDVKENDNEYILEAELPGFNKEDITLETKNGVLTVSATKEEKKEEKDKGYLRVERKTGQFKRSFNIEGIDVEKISAKYTNGVLEVVLPKLEVTVDENKKIQIS